MIAISYALIAPLVLGVAFIGLIIIYTTYRYNLLYIYSSAHDTRGLHYPLALTQTFTGVYLAEICLLGLRLGCLSWTFDYDPFAPHIHLTYPYLTF